MVMVTGITCGAAVTAITTVGTEAADIIMDGTRADIADGIHNMPSRPPRRWGGLVYHGTLFNERDQFRQSPVRCTEFGCCSTCGCGQAAKCSIATFGAFEDFPGDTPTNPVFFSPNGKPPAGPFKGHFHIGQRPGIKAFRNHDCFLHRVAAKPPSLGFARSSALCKK